MAKYLVKKTTHFFDPHGTPEKGGLEKFTTDKEIYSLLKKNKYYTDTYFLECVSNKQLEKDKHDIIEELKESESDGDDLQAMDGYNLRAYTFKVKKITDEEAKEIEETIKKYNKV